MAVVCLVSCDDDDEAKLTADFAASSESVRAGQNVTFSDLSTGQASSWKWTFEGAEPSTSNLSGPTVVYNEPGTYSVTLEIRNKNGSSSVTKEFTVGYNEVVADFTVDNPIVKAGEPTVFTDKSTGGPTAWEWKFVAESGTTLTSAERNPSVTFTELGNYTVTLKVSNAEYSGEVTRQSYLTVIDPNAVVAAFKSDLAATYSGNTVKFTDESVGRAEVWQWTFDGGTPSTSSEQHPTVTYATPGKYKVKLVVSNPVKSDVLEKADYVVVVPVSGLVAFYPFNGSEKDAGPNGIDPSKTGNVTFNGEDRRTIHTSAVFKGDAVLQVPDHPEFNVGTGDFSVSCWVKTNVKTRMMLWMESGMNGSKDLQTWLRMGDNTGTQLARFAVEDAGGGTIVNVSNTQLPNGLSDDIWHHVVCVRQGLASRVYVDGVLKASANAPAVKNVSSAQPFKIGAQQGTTSYSNFYTGLMDDLIIYKKALTQEEITALFNL